MAQPVESTDVPTVKPAKRGLGLRVPVFLFLLLAGCGLLAHLSFAEERARAASQLEVRALGHALLLGGEDPASQAKALATAFLREPFALTFEDAKLARPRAEIGVTVTRDALTELLRDASDARSPLRKLHRQRNGRAPLVLPIPVRVDTERAEAWVRVFASRVDAPARDARVDLVSGTVTPPADGRAVDVQATLDVLQDAIFHGKSRAIAIVRPVRAQAGPALGALDLKGVLGSFESEQAQDDAGRRQLLSQIARALDGALIAPGAEFDFKAQVGLTRGAAPLAIGPVSMEGDRVEAAFAQVAGTIYASALFAGLTVNEQHARANPLSAIELGLESAIDARSNLRFTNDLTAPIALSVLARDGRVRAAVRGPASEAREVELSRLVEVAAPFPEIERPEIGMPLGARALVQRGVPSLRVSLTRIIARGEERVERDVVYLPTPRVVKVGKGGDGGTTVRADSRPEFRVDEHLALTMRPGFELPEETARREGRTGTPGWTAR